MLCSTPFHYSGFPQPIPGVIKEDIDPRHAIAISDLMSDEAENHKERAGVADCYDEFGRYVPGNRKEIRTLFCPKCAKNACTICGYPIRTVKCCKCGQYYHKEC